MKVLMPPQSGSLGNQTASRNRSGQYLRQRSLPVQPRTVSQMAARARFTDMSAAWRGLTVAQRLSWKGFAASFTVVNSLGQTINLTGHQCFVKVNTVNLLLGTAMVNVPPALPTFLALTVTALTATAGTPAMALAGTTAASGTKFMCYASAQVSPGISYMNSWKYICDVSTFTTGSFNLLAAYTAIFGTLVASKQIFVKVVQSQAGMQDNGTVFSCIVAA